MAPAPGLPSANRALAVVALGVLLASSTWFSGTAVAPSLRSAWALSEVEASWLTVSVQLGFIAGTLGFALLNVADVVNPRRLFLYASIAGAALNGLFAALADGLPSALPLRFLTGVSLAGVYPVGMKIVATWFPSGLGWRLGILVGALTMGTALPYLVRAIGAELPWRHVAGAASVAALAGGALVRWGNPDGPHLRGRSAFEPRTIFRVFAHAPFRYTALAYFGHMWELYALWSLVSSYLGAGLASTHPAWRARVPMLAFLTVAAGAAGCVAGGWWSRRIGERRVALASLLSSGAFCLLSGLLADAPPAVVVPCLLAWGVVVVSDSPQFSALAARHCPPAYTGTALAAQLGIGFAVTVISIQLVAAIAGTVGWQHAFIALAPGPLLGAVALVRLGRVAQ